MTKVTIDKLAGMMLTQFKDLQTEFKSDIKELKEELKDEMHEGFKDVNDRLDIIEGKLINNHENRISRLEDDMRLAKTRLEEK
jgi:hypothetical protein